MKKVAILLLAILIFSCSDDDEKGTVENKGQWAMIFNESVKNDSNPVDKTEKFMFDGERLIQHIIKQRYFEEEISNEVNLNYSDNQVTVTTDYLTLVYTLNSEGYASQCVYSLSSQNRIYQFSYSAEGYLTGIVENIDNTEYSSTSLTYENGDITSISSKMNGLENKFIYTAFRQLNSEIARLHKKFGTDVPVIAYFQANTNTYAPVEKLRELYYSVLECPQVRGLSIGTRADCLPDDVLDLLSELNEKTALTVEFGMQSMHESTIRLINRCCTHEEFVSGFNRLKSREIRTCLHIINGLPQETPDMMLETVREAARLAPSAVKLQMLHVIKGTPLEKLYLSGDVKLLSREEYINIIVRQLEVLPPEIVIERITGDGDKSKLIAPKWSADKIAVLGGIDKRLANLDTWQGKLYEAN